MRETINQNKSMPIPNSLTDRPKQSPKIPALQDSIGKYLGTLHEQISQLEDRLRPILAVMPETESKGDCPRPPSSTVYDRLEEHNSSIICAGKKIQSITERLEV